MKRNANCKRKRKIKQEQSNVKGDWNPSLYAPKPIANAAGVLQGF